MAELAKGDVPHGAIRVALPRMKSRSRTSHFDVEGFAAGAYTVDGSDLGEFGSRTLMPRRRWSKSPVTMCIPAVRKRDGERWTAMRFHAELPAESRVTDGYEGFPPAHYGIG